MNHHEFDVWMISKCINTEMEIRMKDPARKHRRELARRKAEGRRRKMRRIGLWCARLLMYLGEKLGEACCPAVRHLRNPKRVSKKA